MRRLRLIGVAVALAVLVLLVVSPLASSASGGSRNTKYQWDIINFDFATSTITAGGRANRTFRKAAKRSIRPAPEDASTGATAGG